MINTFYQMDILNSGKGFYIALLIGFFFGFILERAGFGSSRKLSGVFYFRDMAVIKVMMTAMVTTMIGLAIFTGLGLINPLSQIYHMKTYYGTHLISGLIFGVGFVVSGWCPGTGAVGAASGKIDAMVFIVAGVLGSILYNEVYPIIKPLSVLGQSKGNVTGVDGVTTIYHSLKMSRYAFTIIFVFIAISFIWMVEYIEKNKSSEIFAGEYFGTDFLKKFSKVYILVAITLIVFVFSDQSEKNNQYSNSNFNISAYLESIEQADDHIDPEELAGYLYSGNTKIALIDIRSPAEFNKFHLKGAHNISMKDLPEMIARFDAYEKVVLYSNGMTHPAQARDLLYQMGYTNIYMLTDGLNGFITQILKPSSLRAEPLHPDEMRRINEWRHFFL